VDVIDIGEITTDMLYFAVGNYGYSGGIVVSASHNPKDYNGMKLVREKVAAISSDTGLFDIRDVVKQGKDHDVTAARQGSRQSKDILDDYLKHVMKSVDGGSIRKFTFVGNANFGYVCRPVRRLVETLNLDLLPLNFEPDGTFPKGPPDPLLASNRVETEALTKSSQADFGVAWDADADRVMFFDEHGEFISGAYITALLANILLDKYGIEIPVFEWRGHCVARLSCQGYNTHEEMDVLIDALTALLGLPAPGTAIRRGHTLGI
jgi:phosphomannomutase